jgi:2-keto-4-pentenoate hydratase
LEWRQPCGQLTGTLLNLALACRQLIHLTGLTIDIHCTYSTKATEAKRDRSLAAYHHLGVEFEVAVRLGDDLPASGGPWTRASVASKVAACLPAFELVEDGDADYKTLDAFTLIAQNTWNGGVVLGAPVTAWRGIDLEASVTRCWINDAPSGQGKTGDALGHPFEAVAWLANLLNRHARQLTRDMIVMTGSSITTKFPAPGDRIRFAIDGLGEIALEVTR